MFQRSNPNWFNSQTQTGRSLRRAAWSLLPGLACIILLPSCIHTRTNPPPSVAAAPVQVKPNPLFTTPMPPPGPRPIAQSPNGSLWPQGNVSLFKDIKASKIGDLITITVSEESKASKSATTQTSRDKTLSAQMDFAGVAGGGSTKVGDFSMGPLEGKFKNGFNGTGATSKEDSMTAYMTATVVDVAPNGNLIIRGSRWTQVNNEMQQIVLEGVVRPTDVTRHNTVLSQNVAEARISFVGKGPLTQHQKPGWAMRLIDLISPF
ncbi:MAG: flagellar basal body L-ring protein FlgH [Deltaproteobacteria bacterium]|nr:flagellar basal body L-ring protein FlgH [Deltaproteobacteria bacterium]